MIFWTCFAISGRARRASPVNNSCNCLILASAYRRASVRRDLTPNGSLRVTLAFTSASSCSNSESFSMSEGCRFPSAIASMQLRICLRMTSTTSLLERGFFPAALRREKRLLLECTKRVGNHVGMKDFFLQTGQELILKSTPSNQERVRACT